MSLETRLQEKDSVIERLRLEVQEIRDAAAKAKVAATTALAEEADRV
jgi:hypothetical protein